MWNILLTIYILIFNCFFHLTVNLQEILLINDDTNSTKDEFLISTKNSLPTWTNQQSIICIISVSLGTFLVIITFIVPAMIIIRRTRQDKNRLDLRELRRMSDFM